MKQILVSLVSDQTIPNILAIHHFKPDELLFISTPEMEKKHKTMHILDCLAGMKLDYMKSYTKLEIMEDSIHDCHRKLDEWIIGREECDFTVNLTGGTKIMSISAYDYFKDLESRRMIYIPIRKNEYITPFTKRAINKAAPMEVKLTVADYLAAYGLKIINGHKLVELKRNAEARAELSAWIVRNYNQIKTLLVWLGGALREHRKDRKFVLEGSFSPATLAEKELLSKLNFHCDGRAISKLLSRSEILYLTGGWLEEFCFNEVDALVSKGIDDVVTGIHISNEKGTDNEFDVMFTSNNALYTVECKSLDQNIDNKTDALYKIAALQKDFGLSVESFFVSTSPHILIDGMINPAVAARAEQFRTTVVSAGEVMDFSRKVVEKLHIY